MWDRGALVWVHFGHGGDTHQVEQNRVTSKNYFKLRRIQRCNSQRRVMVVEHDFGGFSTGHVGRFYENFAENWKIRNFLRCRAMFQITWRVETVYT